jgi:basic membrane protein A and related proteins
MNKPRVFLSFVSVLVIIAFTLAACAPAAPAAPAAQAPAAQAKPLRVALVMGCKVDDGDWCQAAYEGLMEAKKQFGDKIDTTYTEDTAVPDFERVMRDFANQGYDMVICHSSMAKEAVTKVAKDFPKVKFLWTDGDTNLDNLATILSKTEEAS